jgi:methionyl-tRNA synthetase
MACREELEAKFQEVKAYIREHKGVGINEVAEACDVDPQQITQWLREDRLEVTEDSAVTLQCESCGATIRSGRYCENCKNSLTKGLNAIVNANKPAAPVMKKNTKDAPKMRFLDNQ